MNVVESVFSSTGGAEKVADIIGRPWSENTVKKSTASRYLLRLRLSKVPFRSKRKRAVPVTEYN